MFDHPFFSVTHRNGRFTISGLPEGTYTVVLWHEFWKEKRLVDVKVGGEEKKAADGKTGVEAQAVKDLGTIELNIT